MAMDIKGKAKAMSEWSVELEAPRGADTDRFDLADEIIDALAGHGPAVSFTADRVSVRFDVEARSPFDAFALARDIARDKLKLDPVRATVESVEDVERYVETSNAPELVGVAEAATMLGVSRQRVSELAEQPAFPAPLARLKAGPVWTAASMIRFTETWDRRPGRPRQKIAASSR
jgi:hypothetical protein